MEETRPLALECELVSESFDIPVWPDVDERFQPMMGEDLTGVPYLDASTTASHDRSDLAVLVNRYLDQPPAVGPTFEAMEVPVSGRLRRLAAESPFAQTDFDQPDRLRIQELSMSSVTRPATLKQA